MSEDTSQENLHPSSEEETDEDAWTPPDTLPPPRACDPPSFPVIPLLISLAAALGLGLVMYGIAQYIYFYIVFNYAIGLGVAWGLKKAPLKHAYFNATKLGLLAIPGCILAYVIYDISFALLILDMYEDAAKQDPSLLETSFGFIDALAFKFENETFIEDIEPGLWGNISIQLAEVTFSIFIAWNALKETAKEFELNLIPPEVFRFAMNGMGNGWSAAQLREELALRGWTSPDDQAKVLWAREMYYKSLAS